MRYIELTESENTVSLYHGGRDLEFNHLEVRGNKSKQFQHGVGLYLISDIEIAAKFAKGGNKLYRVTIGRGNRADAVHIDRETALDFAKKVWASSPSVRKDFLESFNRSVSRSGNDTIVAEHLFNLLLNFDFITPAKSLRIRSFLIEQGVDYHVSKNYGGSSNTMVVVVNPRIIKKVEIIKWDDIDQKQYNLDVEI